MRNVLIVAGLVFVSSSCLQAGGQKALNGWVSSHIGDGERLLCQMESSGDYFFVARAKDAVKTGYRINVTGEDDVPRAYVISWEFLNERGQHIRVPDAPEVVAQGYKSSGDLTYAEEVSYRQVRASETKRLTVKVGLAKFDASDSADKNRSKLESDVREVASCTSDL